MNTSVRQRPFRGTFQVLDEDSKMMQSGEFETMIDLILFEIQHRNIDRTVGQHYSSRTRIVETTDFLEAKNLLVELGLFFGVLAGDSEMLNSGHGLAPCWNLLAFSRRTEQKAESL